MEGILVAQDEVASNFEEFWRDDRFPQFEAERQLLQAVRTRNFSAASMIVKSNHGHSCDVNACVPRVSAESHCGTGTRGSRTALSRLGSSAAMGQVGTWSPLT